MLAVTMHTKSYAGKAKRLVESSSRVGITLVDHPIDPGANWRRTTHKKASIVLAAMRWSGEDILWVDSDSEFRRYPIDCHRLAPEVSVAAFNAGGFLWGCTIFWRNNTTSLDILYAWAKQNSETPQYSADCNLWALLREGQCSDYGRLPQSYAACWRPDKWGLREVPDPVVFHFGTMLGPEKYSGIRHPAVTE